MSLQERLGSQNAVQLISLAAGLSLTSAGITGGFTYNFALMLFGIVAHELNSSTEPLRIFLSFVAFSAIFDILSLLSGNWSGLTLIFALVVLILKAPIFFSCMNSLRERGSDLRWGVPSGLQGGLQGLGERVGAGQGGWSMPVGFGNASSQPTAGGAGAQGTFPSSGGFRLGSEDDEAQAGPPPAPAPGRNGYSSIA